MEILISPPKEVFITEEEFRNFTVYDLSCFFINYKIVFSKEDAEGMIKMWTTDYNVYNVCHKNWRFKGSEWYRNERLDLIWCKIKDEELKKLANNKFAHLFFK